MTDFLHPQNISSSEQTANVSVEANQKNNPQGNGSVPVQKNIAKDVSAKEPVKSNEVRQGGLEAEKGMKVEGGGAIAPLPNRNFESEDETKRIVRKESPIFVHYYQSVFLLLIALFVVSGYFVLSPLISGFKRTNQSIELKLKEKDEASTFLESINNSIKAAQLIDVETLARINEALPKEVDVPILLKTFASIASKDGVKMSGLQISEGSESPDLPSYGGYSLVPIRISLSVEADGYLAMKRYLEDVQLYIRLMDAKSISVGGGDPTTGAFSYSLELNTYYMKKAVALPQVGSVGSAPGAVSVPSAPEISQDISDI